MAYDPPTDTELFTDKPGIYTVFRRLRDMIPGLAAGDTGAPKIQTAAIADNAVGTTQLAAGEQMTTTNVLAKTAAASIGAIGSYALLARSTLNTTITANSTYAGSGLRYNGASVYSSSAGSNRGTALGSAPSGTWRALGSVTSAYASGYPTTLFKRIS